MIKEHAKGAISPIHGCSVRGAALHIFSLFRVLELKGTHSLPTPGIRQLQSSPEPQESSQSTLPLQVQDQVLSLALGI